MQQVYISDTNIWIDFRNAGLLEALFDLPFTFCCTDFVLSELADFDHRALLKAGLAVEALDASTMERLFALMGAHNNSSLADVSCYLLARDTNRALLTGDGRLRKQAKGDGLTVHGALWLLDQMVDHAVIPPVLAAAGLRAMLTAGARLPPAECLQRLLAWES